MKSLILARPGKGDELQNKLLGHKLQRIRPKLEQAANLCDILLVKDLPHALEFLSGNKELFDVAVLNALLPDANGLFETCIGVEGSTVISPTGWLHKGKMSQNSDAQYAIEVQRSHDGYDSTILVQKLPEQALTSHHHHQQTTELFLCVKGACSVSLQTDEHHVLQKAVPSNDILCVSPGTYHQLGTQDSTALNLLCMLTQRGDGDLGLADHIYFAKENKSLTQ